MSKFIILYGSAALSMLVGLLCLYTAFWKKTAKERMIKALQPPPPRNYGSSFLLLFGILCVISAILLIFKTR